VRVNESGNLAALSAEPLYGTGGRRPKERKTPRRRCSVSVKKDERGPWQKIAVHWGGARSRKRLRELRGGEGRAAGGEERKSGKFELSNGPGRTRRLGREKKRRPSANGRGVGTLRRCD